MYKKKLCLSASKSYGISFPEQIRLFKKTGFEGFFVLWEKGMDEDIKECFEVAKEENMIFQSKHENASKRSNGATFIRMSPQLLTENPIFVLSL